MNMLGHAMAQTDSHQRPKFDLRPIHMGCEVDEVAKGMAFLVLAPISFHQCYMLTFICLSTDPHNNLANEGSAI